MQLGVLQGESSKSGARCQHVPQHWWLGESVIGRAIKNTEGCQTLFQYFLYLKEQGILLYAMKVPHNFIVVYKM